MGLITEIAYMRTARYDRSVCILFTLKDRFPLISEGLQGFFPVLGLQQWLVRGPFKI